MVEQSEQFESGDKLPLFNENEIVEQAVETIETVEETKVEQTKVATPFPHMERPRKTLAQMAAEAQQESNQGKIECPHCGCQDFRTTNTKVVDGFRKRLRRCRHCGYPLNTIEFVLRD